MKKINQKMRIYHRYLGFLLAGIMFVYAVSGILLIFRDTDFLKQERIVTKQLSASTEIENLGKVLRIRNFKIIKTKENTVYFKQGEYNKGTNIAIIKEKKLPYILYKMTELHKAKSSDPLFWLNICFGLGLLFFVISAFWMFTPNTKMFKKGIIFSVLGIILTLSLLFI